MSQSFRKLEVPPAARELGAQPPGAQETGTGRNLPATLAINIGIALFVLDGLWQLLHGPSATSAEHRLHVWLLYSGPAAAGVAWIAGSRGTPWVRGAISVAVVCAAIYFGVESVRRFEADERLLSPGAVEEGRVVYENLGLSFAIIPDWRMNLHPFIINSGSKSGRAAERSRLAYGETAAFFQAVPKTAAEAAGQSAESIQVEGGPYNFKSLGRTLDAVRGIESSYRAMHEVKILRPTHFYRLGNLDFAEFELLDEAQRIRYRHAFTRCGEIRLDFVVTSADTQVAPPFDEFLRSIRITRHPTRFND